MYIHLLMAVYLNSGGTMNKLYFGKVVLFLIEELSPSYSSIDNSKK